MNKNIRPIAIYLPQFHPIPENDEWWGKGFTEWTNVTKAKPLFKSHYQPHLPADLGFYDLRVPEVREAQAEMAKKYGIYGFCYYHYWFSGKRILERPFQEVFESGKPDFPFMLCWANENWTRVWDGGEKNVLLQQNYSAEDYENHIHHLIPYFKDPRYIKIDGKVVFAIYNSAIIPNINELIKIWRQVAKSHQIEIYFIRFETFQYRGSKFMEGFNAAAEFQPHSGDMALRVKTLKDEVSLATIKRSIAFRLKRLAKKITQQEESGINSYRNLVENELSDLKTSAYKLYPSVCVGFDNSPRRNSGYGMLVDNNPQLFKKWLAAEIDFFTPYSKEENLFFVNAWNEWAEGNHLEPDRKWGHAYLQALKEVVANNNQ